MPVYRCSFVSVLVCVCVNFTERLARVVKKSGFFFNSINLHIDLMLNIAQLLIIVDVDYWMSMFDGF